MATRVVKAKATINPDPAVKSRAFVAPLQGGYQAAQLRASEIVRYTPGSFLSTVAWKGRQVAQTRFLEGRRPSTMLFTWRVMPPGGPTDPGAGRAGFTTGVNPASALISKTYSDGGDASGFLANLSSATTIVFSSTTRVRVNTLVGASIADEGTYVFFLPTFAPGGFGGNFDDGEVIRISYT